MRRAVDLRRAGLGLCFMVLGLWPPAATAQDIEAVARMRGVSLPAAYYARVASDPTAYTLPNGLFRVGPDGRVEGAGNVRGTHRLLVLPALFSDSQEPHITREMVARSLFDGPAPRGTVTEAYAEMSRGALNLLGDVLPWVRTSRPMAEIVGEGNGLGEDAQLAPYFLEALELADPLVDYGLYDNDGPDGIPNSGDDDGFVDAMTFEFLEVAGSCGGPSIWPHRWGIAAVAGEPHATADLRPDGTPVMVNGYIVQSVADCSGLQVQDANVISHEYGHVLGLPDYYHPTAEGGAMGRRWVLGCWELMAAGSWGCGPFEENRTPFGPSHMSARTKHVLGWLDFEDVGPVVGGEFVLEPVRSSGRGLRIPLDSAGREYLLLEYRTQEGFDHEIPASGVLLYHQDLQGLFRPPVESDLPYFLRLVEQDDDGGLIRNTFEGGDRGVAADAWGVDGVEQSLHALTAPALLRNDGTVSSVILHSIEVDGGVARVRLSTAATPRLVAPGEPWSVSQVTSFERRLLVGGGFMPYRLTAVAPEGLSVTLDEDEVVVSGALAEAGLYQLSLRVEDGALSVSPDLVLPLAVGDFEPAEARLLQLFLGSQAEPLSEAEMSYLDLAGNANGQYDVGDLRAWLRR